tara:strand:+ start:901 stop:1137 length:237 start_codon:yes stop_codon:yes gene_type:complete
MQHGFKEINVQISLLGSILDNRSAKCWWNNRRSLFLSTDFLLTLLLIEIAHFIEFLFAKEICWAWSFGFALVILKIIE